MNYIEKIKEVSNKSKYTKWYVNICENAQNRRIEGEYVEVHHILPISFKMGGEKAKNNLVELTIREHFLVHHLLTKMISGELLRSMRFAFWCMFSFRSDKIPYSNSRFFENARKQFITEQSKNRIEWIENNPEYSEICTNRFAKMWRDPELREHLTQCRNDYWSTETARDKQSKKRKEWFENPENLAKQTEINREISSRPEWRKKRVENQKRLHKEEGYTKSRVDAMHTPDAIAKSKAKLKANIEAMTEQERKDHFGKGSADTIWINDGVTAKKLKNTEQIPEGWVRGNLNMKGRKYYVNLETRQKKVLHEQLEGWIEWSMLDSEQKKLFPKKRDPNRKTVKGSIWITNGLLVTKLAAGLSIPDGWQRGRPKLI